MFGTCVSSCTYEHLYVLGAICGAGSCVCTGELFVVWGGVYREIDYMNMVRRLCVLRAVCVLGCV